MFTFGIFLDADIHVPHFSPSYQVLPSKMTKRFSSSHPPAYTKKHILKTLIFKLYSLTITKLCDFVSPISGTI